MNKTPIYRCQSSLFQIALSAARESEKICKSIFRGNNSIQTICTVYRRKRRLILYRIYTPSKRLLKKKTYKIRSVHKILLPAKRYRYICLKLSYLADRQSKIILLCRIYGISANILTDLFAEQALAFTLIYYHLSHIKKSKSDGLYQQILQVCQDIIHSCEEFAWISGQPADHRALMRKDVADEFRAAAEGICEILALTLVSETVK